MSFAVSRMAIAASLAAALLMSTGGAGSPQSVAAASFQSVEPVRSAESVRSVGSAQSANSSQSAPSAQSAKSAKSISQRARIVQLAKSHVGAHYRFGAEGMTSFDCSGLVWRVYKQAGLEAKIGSARKGARAYYHWFKRRGLASRSNPKPGDLVIWHKGTHMGIYVGNGEIISALNKKYGVRVHGLNFVSGFTAYLHVQLN